MTGVNILVNFPVPETTPNLKAKWRKKVSQSKEDELEVEGIKNPNFYPCNSLDSSLMRTEKSKNHQHNYVVVSYFVVHCVRHLFE